jgi:hypothetical protein
VLKGRLEQKGGRDDQGGYGQECSGKAVARAPPQTELPGRMSLFTVGPSRAEPWPLPVDAWNTAPLGCDN